MRARACVFRVGCMALLGSIGHRMENKGAVHVLRQDNGCRARCMSLDLLRLWCSPCWRAGSRQCRLLAADEFVWNTLHFCHCLISWVNMKVRRISFVISGVTISLSGC